MACTSKQVIAKYKNTSLPRLGNSCHWSNKHLPHLTLCMMETDCEGDNGYRVCGLKKKIIKKKINKINK